MAVSYFLAAIASLPLLARASLDIPVLAAPGTPGHFHCKFRLHGLEFDLCDLVNDTPKYIYHAEDTPPTRTSMVHMLSLKGPLKYNETKPAKEQCPDGTWICFKKWNSIPGDENSSRLLEVIPIASEKFIAPPPDKGSGEASEAHDHLNVSITLGDQWVKEKHPPVVMWLHGGRYGKSTHRAVVAFHCDEEVPGLSNPYVSRWGSSTWHIYVWRTKHACPLNGWSSHRHKPKPDARLPGQDGSEGLHGGSKSVKSAWFWIGTIAFFGTAAHILYKFVRSGGARMDFAFILSALAALPQALLSLPTTVMQACFGRRRRPPRPEHAQLLWAAEDMDDEPHMPRHSVGKGSSIPGFGIDDEDVEGWSPPSPSRTRFSGPYPPTYGIATPRSPGAQGPGENPPSGNVLGKAVDFVKTRF